MNRPIYLSNKKSIPTHPCLPWPQPALSLNEHPELLPLAWPNSASQQALCWKPFMGHGRLWPLGFVCRVREGHWGHGCDWQTHGQIKGFRLCHFWDYIGGCCCCEQAWQSCEPNSFSCFCFHATNLVTKLTPYVSCSLLTRELFGCLLP